MGNAGQQRARIGRLGRTDDRCSVAFFHDPALMHDGDAVGVVNRCRQVVRDHKDTHFGIRAQLIEQFEHAGAH